MLSLASARGYIYKQKGTPHRLQDGRRRVVHSSRLAVAVQAIGLLLRDLSLSLGAPRWVQVPFTVGLHPAPHHRSPGPAATAVPSGKRTRCQSPARCLRAPLGHYSPSREGPAPAWPVHVNAAACAASWGGRMHSSGSCSAQATICSKVKLLLTRARQMTITAVTNAQCLVHAALQAATQITLTTNALRLLLYCLDRSQHSTDVPCLTMRGQCTKSMARSPPCSSQDMVSSQA